MLRVNVRGRGRSSTEAALPDNVVPFVVFSVAGFSELMNDFRNLNARLLACPKNGAVDSVYRSGLMAEFRGSTKTAIQANTCKQTTRSSDNRLRPVTYSRWPMAIFQQTSPLSDLGTFPKSAPKRARHRQEVSLAMLVVLV